MKGNLSKIKPKLRTSGSISGNFGRAKVKAGSTLNDLGNTNAEIVVIPRQSDYIKRMLFLYRSAEPHMREFARQELHRLNCFAESRIPPAGVKPEDREWLRGR